MKLLRSLCMTLRMYSRIPAPKVEWKDENMAYAMCFFPVVGLIEGALLLLWYFICLRLGVGKLLFAAVAVLMPAAVNGGIHLDGFCDCCDAIASHQTKEKKLEIMKDSSAGAFAVISCAAYLIIYTALWSEVRLDMHVMLALAICPVLSRAFSGFAVVSLKNARTGGLLATFSKAADTKKVAVVMMVWAFVSTFVIVLLSPWEGTACALGALGMFIYYRVSAYIRFGGITGDTAGWFLQLCELICLAAAVVLQKIMLMF